MSSTIEQPRPRLQAVIFVGPSSVSMMISERRKNEKPRTLDILTQPLDLAHEIFSSVKISREIMDQCVQIIQSYLELLEEYRSATDLTVHLRGTNILLDVENLDTVINRIQIANGLRLRVMDDGEMTRLLYLISQSGLAEHQILKNKCVLVLHVGPGNTRLMVAHKGRITYYTRYRTGAFRIIEGLQTDSMYTRIDECQIIRDQLRPHVDQIVYDFKANQLGNIDALLIVTPEFYMIQEHADLGEHGLSAEGLMELARKASSLKMSKRAERYALDYANVRSFLPSVLFYQAVAARFKLTRIAVHSEKDGHTYLRNLMPSNSQNEALEKEVIHFSYLLAKRYHADQGHSKHVSQLSNMLFDQLQSMHQLEAHDRLLLNVASILHEVGMYINPKKHHHHSQYIILNSEIFGLSRDDIEIVGLLARYHRHGSPSMKLRFYAEMEEKDRLRVQKLSALLRVADAMERANARRITSFTARINGRRLELIVPGVHDLSVENLSLRSKSDLFTDIFGYEVILLSAIREELP